MKISIIIYFIALFASPFVGKFLWQSMGWSDGFLTIIIMTWLFAFIALGVYLTEISQ